MAFNWKSLFIEPTEAEKAAALEAERLAKTTEMPAANTVKTTMPSQPQVSNVKMSTNGDAFNEVLAVYEKGFDGLNQEGYDFFELYKSVMAVGADNPQAYQMAFAMGKSIKADLSKSFLLEKASGYVAEIEKVHARYAEVGNKKKADLAGQLNAEKSDLTNSIKNIESQIASLQSQLNKQKAELSQIDQKYGAPLAEMDAKIGANDGAKQTILNSIQKVINGINQNL
jgi:chaperonin cofactor prefoldin